jgi:hypothetical protein
MLLQTGGGVAAQPLSPANSGVSERRVRVRLEPDCYVEIDNSPVELGVDPETGRIGVRRSAGKSDWIWGGGKVDAQVKDDEEQEEEWIVKKAHWRLRVEPVDGEGGKMQVVLCGVRIEGFSVEKARNRSRGFLGS